LIISVSYAADDNDIRLMCSTHSMTSSSLTSFTSEDVLEDDSEHPVSKEELAEHEDVHRSCQHFRKSPMDVVEVADTESILYDWSDDVSATNNKLIEEGYYENILREDIGDNETHPPILCDLRVQPMCGREDSSVGSHRSNVNGYRSSSNELNTSECDNRNK